MKFRLPQKRSKMSADSKPPIEPKPYTWDKELSLPPETLQLWKDVGDGIVKGQSVVWRKAVESLDEANKHLRSSKDSREFIDNYMFAIIDILIQQYPSKLGKEERDCVEESLILAVAIISQDLEIQIERNGECRVLNILSMMFDKTKNYYSGVRKDDGKNGKPEIRIKAIDRFGREMGFKRLHRYAVDRAIFPFVESTHHVLSALNDSLPERNTTDDKSDNTAVWPESLSVNNPVYITINVANAAMQFVNNGTDVALEILPPDDLTTLLLDLQKIFDRLIYSHRGSACKFYSFWRDLILKMITSKSASMKLLGWQQVGNLLKASARDRPPPREFEVSSAGCTLVNGKYTFLGEVTPDGYTEHGVGSLGEGTSYQRVVPQTGQEGGGKKLTLFLCKMRSQQNWWFISEADKEQPGTDRDIDYYQHKSKVEEAVVPPPSGWVTCKRVGSDPPPNVKARGLMVPSGEEFNTLDHQLAQWATENGLVALILQDTSNDSIAPHQKTLIEFLVSMRERDNGVESSSSKAPNMYCLRTSHLLTVWESCTGAVDPDTSTRTCRKLVSLLPSIPSALAISLLQAVQSSLFIRGKKKQGRKGFIAPLFRGVRNSALVQRVEGQDYPYLNEVEEFCLALADNDFVDCTSKVLSDQVRGEALELLWSLLTHPQSSSLKDEDRVEMLWSRMIPMNNSGDSEQQEQTRISGIEESLGQTLDPKSTGSITNEATERPSSLLGLLPDELLLLAFKYLGSGHYAFVAGTSKRCRWMYRKAFSHMRAGNEVVRTVTTIAKIAESVSRSQFYLFQETASMDHASDKTIVDRLTQRMRSNVGKRAASVAKAAALSGNLPVLKYALKQPEGCSIVCDEDDICDNAAKNGHANILEHAISLGCPCNVYTCELAAEYGQLVALQRLRENGCPWDESVCSAAAGNGDLAMLQYARENGCPWNHLTCFYARENGHVDVAQWAIENGCPEDDDDDSSDDDDEDEDDDDDDDEDDDGDY